ncbi:MAG TPA: hypothetical protein VFL97_03400 [Nitrococcus sp.]|nr:hypothetical protein [Nitrococcus sp.]
MGAQALYEPAQRLRREPISPPELGDLAMVGAALGIAAALDEAQVGVTVGAGGADEHGTAY